MRLKTEQAAAVCFELVVVGGAAGINNLLYYLVIVR
jgi:hypothetical protein